MFKGYEKAKLILNKNCIGSLYNLRLKYRNYKFKAETLYCLLIMCNNSSATFLTEGLKTTFDLNDEDIVLYAKKIS